MTEREGLNVTLSTIKYYQTKLRKAGLIERIGNNRHGEWRVKLKVD